MRGTIRCARRGCDKVRNSLVCPHCGHPTCYVSVYWRGRHYKYWRDLNGDPLTDYRRASNLLALIHSKINDKKGAFDPEAFKFTNVRYHRFHVQISEWRDVKVKEAEAGEMSWETIKNYRGYIKNYFHYFDDFDVREIKGNNLEDFVTSLRFGGIGIKTRRNILNALHSFFTWLKRKGVEKGGIAELPTWPVIKGDDSRKRVAIDYETQGYGLSRIPEVHRDVIEFGFETGLRPGELCALQIGDIDLKQRKMMVQRTWSGPHLKETTKGKAKKPLPLSYRACEIAERHISDKLPSAFVFLNPETGRCYRPKKLNQIWRQHSGLDIDHYSAGRHSFCTQILEEGANIFDAQDLMRHVDMSSTRKYYHATTKRLEDIVNRRGKVQQISQKQNGSRTKIARENDS